MIYLSVTRILTRLAALLIIIASHVYAASAAPSTYCRFVPERSDDFAWENDKVAFRVYGPALAKGNENNGIDCWCKRVSYPIVDKWYRLNQQEKLSYHQDRGEGSDFYHVGKSRGCGSTAIWIDGKMHLPNVYKAWKVVKVTPSESIFTLSYEYEIAERRIKEEKTISISLGQRLFKSESVFTEKGKPVALEIAIGLTTHDQRGLATLQPKLGWMSVWEDHHGKNGKLGTGVVMDPKFIQSMQEIKSKQPDESHAVLLCRTDAQGKTVHYAGFGWTKAKGIKTSEEWHDYLKSFIKSRGFH